MTIAAAFKLAHRYGPDDFLKHCLASFILSKILYYEKRIMSIVFRIKISKNRILLSDNRIFYPKIVLFNYDDCAIIADGKRVFF